MNLVSFRCSGGFDFRFSLLLFGFRLQLPISPLRRRLDRRFNRHLSGYNRIYAVFPLLILCCGDHNRYTVGHCDSPCVRGAIPFTYNITRFRLSQIKERQSMQYRHTFLFRKTDYRSPFKVTFLKIVSVISMHVLHIKRICIPGF
jgi:hypothetical protein